MVYAGDQWVQLPTRDLYDTQMMAMAINAAKDMYDKGEKRLDDFYNKYNEFYSPIQKDIEAYNTIIGGVKDRINQIYARGGDPLRNAQDRAEMMQIIRAVPVGDINKLKQSAEVAKEYVKNAGKLAAAGLLNEDAEKNYFNRDLSSWDTLNGSGIWGASSPIENKTVDEIIEPVIKNLDYTYDAKRTKQANDGNDYYTVTEDRIRQTIADSMPDLMTAKTMGGYYYDKALRATGDPEKAKALYTDWLVDRAKDHLKEKFTPNQFKLEEVKNKNKIALENLKHRHAMQRANAKLQQQQHGSYDFATDIYDKGLNNIVGNAGGHMYELGPGGQFLPAEQYFQGKQDLVKAQRDFGKQAMRASKSGGNRYSMYRDRYTHTTGLSGETFAAYLQRDTFDGKTKNKFDWKGQGLVRLDAKDMSRIRTVDDIITNTAGYTSQHRDGNTELLAKMRENPGRYLIGGNNISVYGAFNKPGRYQNDFIVDVYDSESGKKVGEVAYDSYINSEKTTGGFYERNNKSEANTSRNLTTRQAVTAGSTAVNKKLLSLSRKQKMPSVYPIMDDDYDDYDYED